MFLLVGGGLSIRSSSAGYRTTRTLRISSVCYSYFPFCLELHRGSRGRANKRGLYSISAAAKEHPKLLYNSTAYFLAMAIADNALFGIKSLDDLQALEIPPGHEELILSFKESALNRPILRKCTKEKDTMEEIMPRSTFLSCTAYWSTEQAR